MTTSIECSKRGRRSSSIAHRAKLADYLAAKRHVLHPLRCKTILQIARETATTPSTVRRWLKTDHYEEWVYWWLPAAITPGLEWVEREDALLDLPELDPAAMYREAETY